LQIDADDFAGLADYLSGDLEPTAGRGAEIDDRISRLEQMIALLQFKQLVGGTRTVTFLLGFFVVTIAGIVGHRGWLESGFWTLCQFNGEKKAQPGKQVGLGNRNFLLVSARSLHLKFHPAINRSCPLGVLIDQRFALADACGRHAIGVDALGRKLFHHRLSAPLT